MDQLPDTLIFAIALVGAVLGGLGGFAALLKVSADNSKTVSDGAAIVVKMLETRITELEARQAATETHVSRLESWADRVELLLKRTIDFLPLDEQDSFRLEADRLHEARPDARRPARPSSRAPQRKK